MVLINSINYNGIYMTSQLDIYGVSNYAFHCPMGASC